MGRIRTLALSFVVLFGGCGEDMCENYAQVTGPSHEGAITLLVNSNCGFYLGLEDTSSLTKDEVFFAGSNRAFDVQVLDREVVVSDAFVHERVLQKQSEGRLEQLAKPKQTVSVYRTLGRKWSWELAKVNRGDQESVIVLNVRFVRPRPTPS